MTTRRPMASASLIRTLMRGIVANGAVRPGWVRVERAQVHVAAHHRDVDAARLALPAQRQRDGERAGLGHDRSAGRHVGHEPRQVQPLHRDLRGEDHRREPHVVRGDVHLQLAELEPDGRAARAARRCAW